MVETELIATTEVQVRFSDTDTIGVVWHGNYIKYFEDGREAFGEKFGIDYLYISENGYVAPLVEVHCDYKRPLRYGDIAIIETRYVDTPAAKARFEYKIYKKGEKQVIATGHTVQVFLDSNDELMLVAPKLILDWKKKVGLT